MMVPAGRHMNTDGRTGLENVLRKFPVEDIKL